MSKYRKLNNVYYKYDYHIVFTPKYLFQILEGMVKLLVEHDLQVISACKAVLVLKMNVQKEHIHLAYSISPKVSISEYMGILKGKIAIKLFKIYLGLKQKPYWNNHFWTRGYFVCTIGLNEGIIKRYVKYEEHHK